ncbi:MAG: carboxypeptidase regulatory-like domain-containing protein [Thermoplasmatales archaeon]|nr:carboxypeptidase regulatory-like domain-containing protein [Thermoplasmatales archaeon]
MNKKIFAIGIIGIFITAGLTTASATIVDSTIGGNIACVIYGTDLPPPPEEAGLEGITVKLTNQDGTITRTTESSENGKCIFLDLPFDEEYTITAEGNNEYKSNTTVVYLTEQDPHVVVFIGLDPKSPRLFRNLNFPFIKLFQRFTLLARLLNIK